MASVPLSTDGSAPFWQEPNLSTIVGEIQGKRWSCVPVARREGTGFSSIQDRTYRRSRHLTVRGERGEWSDTLVRYLDERGEPGQRFLLPEIPAEYRCLDNQALRDRRRNWQADLAPDTVQDEFAIATLLLDMGRFSRGEGENPYPLREALEDAYTWLKMEEAVGRPWEETASERMPWQ